MIVIILGIGQAPVRGLAFQLAAIDMLEKIKFYNKEKFPVYGLPPGTRINPKIIKDLMTFCKVNGLDYPKISIDNSGVPLEERELFDCTVEIGQLTTTGMHCTISQLFKSTHNYLFF